MDKFIKKLIERLASNTVMMANSKEFWNNPQNGEHVSEVIQIEKAIEIANELAEEYNNEFCEWKYDGAMYDICPHTETLFARIHNCDEKIFKHCPYYGKKIKVVE